MNIQRQPETSRSEESEPSLADVRSGSGSGPVTDYSSFPRLFPIPGFESLVAVDEAKSDSDLNLMKDVSSSAGIESISSRDRATRSFVGPLENLLKHESALQSIRSQFPGDWSNIALSSVKQGKIRGIVESDTLNIQIPNGARPKKLAELVSTSKPVSKEGPKSSRRNPLKEFLAIIVKKGELAKGFFPLGHPELATLVKELGCLQRCSEGGRESVKVYKKYIHILRESSANAVVSLETSFIDKPIYERLRDRTEAEFREVMKVLTAKDYDEDNQSDSFLKKLNLVEAAAMFAVSDAQYTQELFRLSEKLNKITSRFQQSADKEELIEAWRLVYQISGLADTLDLNDGNRKFMMHADSAVSMYLAPINAHFDIAFLEAWKVADVEQMRRIVSEERLVLERVQEHFYIVEFREQVYPIMKRFNAERYSELPESYQREVRINHLPGVRELRVQQESHLLALDAIGEVTPDISQKLIRDFIGLISNTVKYISNEDLIQFDLSSDAHSLLRNLLLLTSATDGHAQAVTRLMSFELKTKGEDLADKVVEVMKARAKVDGMRHIKTFLRTALKRVIRPVCELELERVEGLAKNKDTDYEVLELEIDRYYELLDSLVRLIPDDEFSVVAKPRIESMRFESLFSQGNIRDCIQCILGLQEYSKSLENSSQSKSVEQTVAKLRKSLVKELRTFLSVESERLFTALRSQFSLEVLLDAIEFLDSIDEVLEIKSEEKSEVLKDFYLSVSGKRVELSKLASSKSKALNSIFSQDVSVINKYLNGLDNPDSPSEERNKESEIVAGIEKLEGELELVSTLFPDNSQAIAASSNALQGLKEKAASFNL